MTRAPMASLGLSRAPGPSGNDPGRDAGPWEGPGVQDTFPPGTPFPHATPPSLGGAPALSKLLPPGRLSGTPSAVLARSQRVLLFLASLIAGSPIPSILLALSSHPSSPAYAGTSDALTVRGGPLGSC